MDSETSLTKVEGQFVTPGKVPAFSVVRKGFEQNQVLSYLMTMHAQFNVISAELERLRVVNSELERAAENALSDPATVSAVLGREASEILRSASEAAAIIRAKADAHSHEILSEAEHEAKLALDEAQFSIEARRGELESDVRALAEAAKTQAAEVVRDAQESAANTIELAKEEGRSIIQRARDLKAKTLAEMQERIEEASTELERLVSLKIGLSQLLGSVIRAIEDSRDVLEEVKGPQEVVPIMPKSRTPPSPSSTVVLGVSEVRLDSTPSQGPQVTVEEQFWLSKSGRENESQPENFEVHEYMDAIVSVSPIVSKPPSGETEASRDTGETIVSSQLEVQDDPEPLASDGEENLEFLPSPEVQGEVTAIEVEPEGEEGEIAHRRPVSHERLENLFEKLKAARAAEVTNALATLERVERADQDAQPEIVEPTVDELTSDLEKGVLPEMADSRDGSSVHLTQIEADTIQRRDALVSDLCIELVRRTKRLLQDEHNELLDSLRQGGQEGAEKLVQGILDSAHERSKAVRDYLFRSAEIGVGSELGSSKADGSNVNSEEIAQSIDVLSAEMVGTLSRLSGGRILETVIHLEANDEPAQITAIGAIYRELRSQRVDELVGDYVIAAFNVGQLGKTASSYRWLVSDQGSPCPDCEDNYLAGANAKYEDFPTGHRFPPAHSGCRCLIVPLFA